MADAKSTQNSDNGTTRRGFLGGMGVAALATVLPVSSVAVSGRAWAETARSHGAALRAAYLAEVERFAETLRPRFEAGELRAFCEGVDDLRRPGAVGWGADAYERNSPQWKLEQLVAEHFGLAVGELEFGVYEGDAEAARLILAASPHARFSGEGWAHECLGANDAATWDVIAYARARRWYTPAAGECEDPALEAKA